MQDIEDVLFAIGGAAEGLDASRPHHDDRLDLVALVDDDVVLVIARVTGACEKLALCRRGKALEQRDVVHARAARPAKGAVVAGSGADALGLRGDPRVLVAVNHGSSS